MRTSRCSRASLKPSGPVAIRRPQVLLLGLLIGACTSPASVARRPGLTPVSSFNRFHGKTVLVISPHPDDDIIGCGGALAALRSGGNRVTAVFLTSGDYGTEDSTLTRERLVAIRRAETARAYARLGLPDARLVWLPNQSQDLDFADGRAIKRELVRIIRQVRPDLVFAVDPGDRFARHHYHDHRSAAVLSEDAIAAASLPLYLREAGPAYRVPEVFYYYTAEPNLRVDVASVLPTKIAALLEHRSQFSPFKQHYVADTTLPAAADAREEIESFTQDVTVELFRYRGRPAEPASKVQ